jgi:glycosyltransferase involved in cell wall biosynthesis
VISPYYAAHGGGVEIVAGHLAKGLASHGHEVTWAASDTDAADPGASIRCVPMRANNSIEVRSGVPVPLWTPAALHRLWRMMRDSDVVLMHESLYVSNVLAALAARVLRKPLVVVQHVGEVPYRSQALRTVVRLGNAVAARIVHLCAQRVVFVSAVVQDYFCPRTSAARSKSVLIPNGFDPARFHPVEDSERERLRARLGVAGNAPVILFVGRFVEKKGLGLLHELARQRPASRWVFVGSGPIDPAQWGLDQVRVVGRVPQDQLPDWYRAADLLVLPSTGEGFPLVVQEAMGCGLPVAVATETAAALDGVQQSVFSADVHGEPALVLKRWLALLDEAVSALAPECRRKAARFASDHWSWTRCVDQYAAVIDHIA